MKEAMAVSVDASTELLWESQHLNATIDNHLPCPTLYLLDQGISS